MTGICGWFHGVGGPGEVQDAAIESMAVSLRTAVLARPQIVSADGGVLALVSESGDAYKCAESDIAAVIDGPVVWRSPELEAIAQKMGPAAALVRGYRTSGAGVLGELDGAFVLAISDPGARRSLLAADRVGARPLFYARYGDTLIFGSRATTVISHPQLSRVLDSQAVFDYLYFHVVAGPRCIFEGVSRLLPGEYVETSLGKVTVGRYWELDYGTKEPRFELSSYQREFHRLLRDSMRQSADSARIGAFLSGGTDSSTVAGILSEISDVPVATYSIGFDAEGYDETEFARIAAKHFGTEHHEYYVSPEDVVEAVSEIARAYDQPFGNSSAVPTLYCARMAAADGVQRLLGGDGGDEIFGGNYRYGKQMLFSYYAFLPALLRRKAIEPALLSGWCSNVGPLRKLKSYVEQARLPMPERFETYNLINRIGIDGILEPDFASCVDEKVPMQLIKEAYDGANAAHMIDRMLALDMRITLADSDLPKVSRMCELAGVEAAFPLLDRRLVEFAAHLPVEQKVRGTQLRYFFKKALEDFLPNQILDKNKHGFGLPFGLWLKTHKGLHDLAFDSLNALKGRQIVRGEFIDRLIDTHRTEHAGYFGTLVWVLMMLEQWLTAHKG